MEFNINRSTWKKVKLGDVAFEYSKRINDPSKSEYDRFVGSSNIGQWDFRIKSWDSTDSVTSAMKLFQEDDYLLVRRSLYASDFRERAPRAQFPGVCSGDILTIKENPALISNGFLIGILNSPELWKYVVSNASGSITRRIKWRDLANYEFLLPPKSEQAKLAELLWAMDGVIDKEREVLEKLVTSRQIIFENLIQDADGKLVSLSDVLIAKKKKSQTPHLSKKYIGLEHINSGEFLCNKFGDSDSAEAQCSVVENGDLCYSKLRPYLDKAFIASFDAVSTTELLVYDTKKVSKELVLFYLHSKAFLDYVSNKGFGTKMPRVSHSIIGDFKIVIPKDENQILQRMRNFMTAEEDLISKIVSSKALQKSLINQVF